MLPPEVFDAVIKIGPDTLPPNVTVTAASSAIRRAVQAMPGAEMVSVQHHPGGAGRDPVAVFPASGSVAVREALRGQVTRVVAAAVKALDAGGAPPAPPVAMPLVTGFADGQDFHFPVRLKDAGLEQSSTLPAETPAGLSGLSDSNLLATLLDYVVPEQSRETASRAVKRFGSFAAVLSAPEIDLKTLPGLGPHSIAAIKLINAAALRLSLAAVMDQPVLSNPEHLIGYLTAVLARESIEHFRILFLDADGRLRGDEAQARGTVNHTPVYPREVVRRALELRAACIILVHNHPSGDPTPSMDDIEMTARIEQAGQAVGVTVRDHIIVGNGRWFSFSKEGLLQLGQQTPVN